MTDRNIDRELDDMRREHEASDLSAAVAEDYANAGHGENGADLDELAAATGPSTGLLSFYDRLRERTLAGVERRGGRLAPTVVKALLLVPDVFILLVRIVLDPEVPGSARALVGGALAYFVLPIDLLPEGVLGAGGYLEDLVLAAAVLAHTFNGELEPYARKHWSGPDDLRVVLGDIAAGAQSLLGANLYERLKKLMAKRGITVEESAGGGDPD